MKLQSLKDRVSRKTLYPAVMLLTALIGTLAQVVVVPPAWNWWPYEPPKAKTTVTPDTRQPEPKTNPLPSQHTVCGAWISVTSRKRYDFVCGGGGSFEIYEVTDKGLSKNGWGKLTEGGAVEADLVSMPKNRKAHLRLRLSPDGRRMDGSWQGDDPRESGNLIFQRV